MGQTSTFWGPQPSLSKLHILGTQVVVIPGVVILAVVIPVVVIPGVVILAVVILAVGATV